MFWRAVRAAPGCSDSPAILLGAFSIGDLAKSLRGDAGQIRGWLCQGGCGRGGPAASVVASSESATVHSTERRIQIELTGGRRVIVDPGGDTSPDHRGFGSAIIPVPAGVRLWLATGRTDMRNYVEPTIMLSARPVDPRPAPLSTV